MVHVFMGWNIFSQNILISTHRYQKYLWNIIITKVCLNKKKYSYICVQLTTKNKEWFLQKFRKPQILIKYVDHWILRTEWIACQKCLDLWTVAKSGPFKEIVITKKWCFSNFFALKIKDQWLFFWICIWDPAHCHF